MSRPLKRILLVEDDPDVQIVEVCESADDALRTASSFSPDLILMDVMMPGIDGPSAVPAFRAIPATAGTPVVFMTARIQPNDVARYKELGCLDVISKPFDPASLPEALRVIWRRHDG
jgi:two-component system OmpR family response regulator